MNRTGTSHVANAVVLPNLGRQSAYLYGFSVNIRFVLGRLTKVDPIIKTARGLN